MQIQSNYISATNSNGDITNVFVDSIVLGFQMCEDKHAIIFHTDKGIIQSFYSNNKEMRKNYKMLCNVVFPSHILTKYKEKNFSLIFDKVEMISNQNKKTKIEFLNSYHVLYLDEDISSLYNKI